MSVKPNVVFVLVDDLGRRDVGYLGSEIKTPNLDRLAGDGVKLEQYYTAPVCGPTRVELLSGRYAINVGLRRNIIACQRTGLPAQYLTIADHLKEQGYTNHLIGKWHLGFHSEEFLPTSRGFDTFRGFLLGHGDHFTHTRRYKSKPYLDFYDNTTPYNQSWGDYSTEAFTDRAVELINDHHASNPMFMLLSYQAPHNPMQVPEEYLEQYKDNPVRLRRIYAGMVTAIDRGVGRVVQALKDNDLFNDTVIIFSTDNGGDVNSGGSNYPLSGNKGSLYQGGIRGVGFVSSPLLSRPSRSFTKLIHITDWMPTILHLAGANGTLDIDGVNQWNIISDDQASERTEVLNAISRPNRPNLLRNLNRIRRNLPPSLRSVVVQANFDITVRASLIMGNWKLMTGRPRHYRFPDPTSNVQRWYRAMRLKKQERTALVQLFHLKEDPTEKQNLAARHPSVVSQMLTRLAEYQSNAVDPIQNAAFDSTCDPSNNGGVWGPY